MKRLYAVLFALIATFIPVNIAHASTGPIVDCKIPSFLDFSNTGEDVVASRGVHYFYMNYMSKKNDSLPVASNFYQSIYNRTDGCTAYTSKNYFTNYSLKTVGKGNRSTKVFSFKTNDLSVSILQIQLQLCDPTKCTTPFVQTIDGKYAQNASIKFDQIPYKRIVSKTGKVTYKQYKLLTVQVYYLDSSTFSNSYPSNPFPDMYPMPMG